MTGRRTTKRVVRTPGKINLWSRLRSFALAPKIREHWNALETESSNRRNILLAAISSASRGSVHAQAEDVLERRACCFVEALSQHCGSLTAQSIELSSRSGLICCSCSSARTLSPSFIACPQSHAECEPGASVIEQRQSLPPCAIARHLTVASCGHQCPYLSIAQCRITTRRKDTTLCLRACPPSSIGSRNRACKISTHPRATAAPIDPCAGPSRAKTALHTAHTWRSLLTVCNATLLFGHVRARGLCGTRWGREDLSGRLFVGKQKVADVTPACHRPGLAGWTDEADHGRDCPRDSEQRGLLSPIMPWQYYGRMRPEP